MRTSDKSKLNGIEAGATADQTKSDIDALNIDADTLDGQHGNFYLNYNNFNNVPTFDNYVGWSLLTNGTNRGTISSAENVNIVAGTNVNIGYSVTNNTITINSTDTNTDTTFDAGTGLSLTGTTFSLSDERYTSAEKTKLSGIESGATADQTKSDIDALNIDADTLDGQHGNFYLNYNNFTNKPDLSVLNDVLSFTNFASFPSTGEQDKVYIAENTGYMYRWTGSGYTQLTDQTAIWGQISGTLSNQTDLQNTLNSKLNTSSYTAADVKSKYESNTNTNAFTNSEKTKLNGIEAGATADQTIDADTLDGQHGNFYRNASNINNGTINDARLPGTMSSNITGNAATASQLQNNRTFNFLGDATGSSTFNGSGNFNVTLTVQDDSHNHTISNIDGLQSQLDNITQLSKWSVEVTIAAGATQTYNLSTEFGAALTDPRDVMFDIKVLDNVSGSPTNGLWIDASAISTHGVNTSNNIFSLINEFSTTLTFYIRASI